MTYRARCNRRKELTSLVCIAIGKGGRLATFEDGGGIYVSLRFALRIWNEQRRTGRDVPSTQRRRPTIMEAKLRSLHVLLENMPPPPFRQFVVGADEERGTMNVVQTIHDVLTFEQLFGVVKMLEEANVPPWECPACKKKFYVAIPPNAQSPVTIRCECGHETELP
jgi:hypothetical protein